MVNSTARTATHLALPAQVDLPMNVQPAQSAKPSLTEPASATVLALPAVTNQVTVPHAHEMPIWSRLLVTHTPASAPKDSKLPVLEITTLLSAIQSHAMAPAYLHCPRFEPLYYLLW